MSQWITSLEGTPAGHNLALALALSAAVLHALFGALQKWRHDPWLSRGAIDASYGLIAAPIALFVVPWPEPHMWPIFAAVFVIHVGYKLAQAYTYTLGLKHWQIGREKLKPALAMAVLTGGFVAAYTTWDAYGIRATADPFTFLAWFFFIDGLALPPFAYLRWRNMQHRPAPGPLIVKGVIGAFIAYMSFGSIMLATRLDSVGEAAVLRETSTVFAALIGWLVLKESTGPQRVALMALIAAGAVLVEIGG